MPKHLLIAIAPFLILLALVLAFPFSAAAVELFYPAGLVPCYGPDCSLCHVFVLIQNVLNFLWYYISIPLATLMLIYGGALMVVPGLGGNAAMYEKGKKTLTSALLGILIVFLSWLVIDTIIKVLNGELGTTSPASVPKIGGFGPWNQIDCAAAVIVPSQPAISSPLDIGSSQPSPLQPSVGTTPSQPSQPSTGVTQPPNQSVTNPPMSATEAGAREFLASKGILVNKAPCPPGKSYGQVPGGCTNVAGIPSLVLDKLVKIKNGCACEVMITGGTEPGHKSHGFGKPVLDFRFNPQLGSYLKTNRAKIGIIRVCTAAEDAAYRIDCTTNEPVRHLHVEFIG